ncbi:MAG: RsmB/NOP family class I SAM-dependent RNA methyltransferase [Succinivibrionaceae bacterium]|nr:RsmB/NOP family class I SAM-dependent RNA methyltransferase [Succinivibrionaceae bacterium]
MKITTLTPFQFRLATSVLYSILHEKKSPDEAFSIYFRKVNVCNREQALVTRVVGDIMRRLNYFLKLLDTTVDKTASAAGIDRLVHIWHVINNLHQTEGARTEPLNVAEIKLLNHELKKNKALVDGCPEWLETHGEYELGERWPAERRALAQAPKRFIRVNTLKTTREELIRTLLRSNVTSREVENVPSALEILTDASLFKMNAFSSGLFEQQDAGSQMIAPFLDVHPGMRIVDACAGSGGKTLHLAALSKGKGVIIAMDVAEWKLKNLKLRAKRAGAFNIETRLIDTSKVIKRLAGSADRLLLDVPCSGLGVLKRNPDIKWADTASRLSSLYAQQAEILENYSKILKVGGKLVYSTCSIMPVENELQIRNFLNRHPDEFKLEEACTVYPSETGFDGFYMARLARIS